MLLVEGSSETGLLDVYLKTFFVVRKLKNTSATRVNFFRKSSILNLNLGNPKKKKTIQKIFFVSKIIASENVAINSAC